jgi:hypothetical protein
MSIAIMLARSYLQLLLLLLQQLGLGNLTVERMPLLRCH